MAEKGLVFTGARARLLIAGKKVGYARNCSGGEQIQYEPVEALDNIQVEENVPTRYRVNFSMGFVRVVRTTLKSLGYFPKLGSNPEEHLSNVITQGLLTVAIEDNQTGAGIMTLEQAAVTSRNFSIDATGIVGIDVDFVGIRMRDEFEI
jgi:hypothetical protein